MSDDTNRRPAHRPEPHYIVNWLAMERCGSRSVYAEELWEWWTDPATDRSMAEEALFRLVGEATHVATASPHGPQELQSRLSGEGARAEEVLRRVRELRTVGCGPTARGETAVAALAVAFGAELECDVVVGLADLVDLASRLVSHRRRWPRWRVLADLASTC